MYIVMFIFFVIILLLLIYSHIKSAIEHKRNILSENKDGSGKFRVECNIDNLIIEVITSVVYIILLVYFIIVFIKGY